MLKCMFKRQESSCLTVPPELSLYFRPLPTASVARERTGTFIKIQAGIAIKVLVRQTNSLFKYLPTHNNTAATGEVDLKC